MQVIGNRNNNTMIQTIDLVDETYDINTINAYCLSIRVSLDGLSFCIADKQQEKIVAFKHYQISSAVDSEDLAIVVEKLLQDEQSLPKHPIKVTILYVSPNYTLVPEELFVDTKAKELLSVTHHLDELDEVHFIKIEEPKAMLIYTFPSTLASKLRSIFPTALLMPQVFPFLKRLREEKFLELPFVGIHVNENFFDLAIYSQKNLQLLNSYNYKSPSDVLFFLANALNAVGLESATISVAGATEEGMAIIPALKKFYPQTINDPFSGNFTLSYKIRDHVKARFSNLFFSTTCE